MKHPIIIPSSSIITPSSSHHHPIITPSSPHHHPIITPSSPHPPTTPGDQHQLQPPGAVQRDERVRWDKTVSSHTLLSNDTAHAASNDPGSRPSCDSALDQRAACPLPRLQAHVDATGGHRR